MKTNPLRLITPIAILAGIAALALGIWPENVSPKQFREVVATPPTVSRPAEVGAPASQQSPAVGGLATRSPEEPVHREASEVFPDRWAAGSDWRSHHPRTLRVSAYPGVELAFDEVKRRDEGRHLTWVGRNENMPGASFVGVATDDGYDAVLLLPGAGQYNFHARNGRVLVEEVSATGKDCELWQDPAALMSSRALPSGMVYAEAGDGGQADAPGGPVTAAAEGTPTVDVLFLYNTRALEVATQRSSDPIGYIDGYTRAGLETCNQVLANSRIDNFTWRYLGLVAAPEYPEKQTVSEDLAMIAPDGPLDGLVRSVRAEYGADQVLMWVGPGTRQGSAFAGDTRGEAVPVEYAVAGLRLTAGILILAHELAHNFGCHHDRGHAGTGDGSTAQPDGDGNWCYGLLWNDPGLSTTSGTVMAYADYLVPYFSNPDITLNVTSTLENRPGPFRDLGTRTIGFGESDPRAANNARVMREHAPHMAALSQENEAMPVILKQPLDAALLVGETLSLSVSASGGGLNYQWLKDGAEISGATTPALIRTFAATDAGSYRVRITNRRGSAVSRAATVAVVAPVSPPAPAPTPASSPASSASGGGGGGAPGWPFHFALFLIVVFRMAPALRWRTRE